ncbi:MAG TPA: signal peptidase I [Clostridia bacterium]|nr:signal peptidase I [Clostridia bacterium]
MDENYGFETDDKSSSKRRVLTTIIAFVIIVLLAFLAASLIKRYVTDTFTVDGSSMDATLSGGQSGDYTDGDRVVVNHFGKLNRGRIVVLRLEGREHALVKRIIGVEGDRIKIVEGLLYLNGELQNEDYVLERNKIIGNPSPDMPEITVSQGCVFVLGDNRNGSSDSRDFGEVKTEQVEGTVFLILRDGGGFNFV